MSEYQITITIEATRIQDAINNLLYPDGEPIEGVIRVEAVEL